MTDEITTDRRFEKHKILGDIYAVEWLVVTDFAREAVAALRCTKPEQLTRGALPVLTLNGADLDFYKRNVLEFARWEPPMADVEALAEIFAAERYCQETQAALEFARKAAGAAKAHYEKACDDLRRIVREANTEPIPMPLLALAELPDAQEIPDDRPPHDDDGPRADDHDRHPD